MSVSISLRLMARSTDRDLLMWIHFECIFVCFFWLGTVARTLMLGFCFTTTTMVFCFGVMIANERVTLSHHFTLRKFNYKRVTLLFAYQSTIFLIFFFVAISQYFMELFDFLQKAQLNFPIVIFRWQNKY